MPELTILTPAYNRAYTLGRLYQSLKQQSCKGFCWMVVDDGSTDETEQLIQSFREERKVEIFYIKKENGGKHTAINRGIKAVQTTLTYILDSDDYMADDAVETILSIHEKYQKTAGLCGYAFLRCDENGNVNGKRFPEEEYISNYIDVRINRHDTHADKAEVFYTKCLKEFPFPEYPGEKFVGEDLVWMQMALRYDMVHVNKAICVAEYLEDGLTRNRRKNCIASPRAEMDRGEMLLHPRCCLKTRVKGALMYGVYGRFAGKTALQLIKEAKYRGWTLVFTPFCTYIYRHWRKKY